MGFVETAVTYGAVCMAYNVQCVAECRCVSAANAPILGLELIS